MTTSSSNSRWTKWSPWDAISSTPTAGPTKLARTRPTRPLSPPGSPSGSTTSPSTSSSYESTPRSSLDDPVAPRTIDRASLALSLLFTGPASASPAANLREPVLTAPPAFFPAQRVTFSPRLRVGQTGGVPLRPQGASSSSTEEDKCEDEAVSGLFLGVTGLAEALDPTSGRTVTRRLIADICTDLSSGLYIWQRDARAAILKRAGGNNERAAMEVGDGLPAGTYVLPLSMRIPCSDKLPPSFESKHFRLSYTMTLALLAPASARSESQSPVILAFVTVPFHILPSTLPSPPPSLLTLTYDERKATSLFSAILSPPSHAQPAGYHIVTPSLPTSHYSPGSIIPLTLRIASTGLTPRSDLYVRLALVRRLYHRESSQCLDDVDPESGCIDDAEVLSRWGWVRGEDRCPSASQTATSEVVMRDIALPLTEWRHGYSTALDLIPSPLPSDSTTDSKTSWFAPTMQRLVRSSGAAKSASRYVQLQARFYLSVEVGFVHGHERRLVDVLAGEVPPPSSFTNPTADGVNLFPYGVGGARMSTSSSQRLGTVTFPGKLKEILIPITIGSVAEPTMECLVSRRMFDNPAPSSHPPPSPAPAQPEPAAESSSSSEAPRAPLPSDTEAERASRASAAWREEALESFAERAERVGDDGEEAWLCAPPSYTDSLRAAPAYV